MLEDWHPGGGLSLSLFLGLVGVFLFVCHSTRLRHCSIPQNPPFDVYGLLRGRCYRAGNLPAMMQPDRGGTSVVGVYPDMIRVDAAPSAEWMDGCMVTSKQS